MNAYVYILHLPGKAHVQASYLRVLVQLVVGGASAQRVRCSFGLEQGPLFWLFRGGFKVSSGTF